MVADQAQLASIAFESRKLKLNPLEATVTSAPSVSSSFIHDPPTLSTRRRGRQIETADVGRSLTATTDRRVNGAG